MKQYYINHDCYMEELEALFQRLSVSNIFVVCGQIFFTGFLNAFFSEMQKKRGIKFTYFTDFSPNPKCESIQNGVRVFKQSMCDMIIAVGGGSAIDVAKCIKLFAKAKSNGCFSERWITTDSDVPLLAIPTTAGTGSEATQFAVIYIDDEKRSVEDESILPHYVLLHPDVLRTLPDYQKKVTVCDALSHAIESYWSVNSTLVSKQLSEKAIRSILKHMDAYMQNDEDCYESMLKAANYAGQAINVTRTTAAHAMSYKLTTTLNISHGHAVMLCLPEVWEYLANHLEDCVDVRGRQYLQKTLDILASLLNQRNSMDAIQLLKRVRSSWGLDLSIRLSKEQRAQLVESVNIERLSNFPIALSKGNLTDIYQKIFMETK